MKESTALATAPPTSLVTADHLQLIKATIAKDATPAELELFLYDNARQGVHPLDKLIHFTKRSGKYTPITSIDFMRIRAAESGECAGIDDPIFQGTPAAADFAAQVTVYRLVQGQRAAFTATARWREYKPESNDFMWKKMPYVMLGKCAEALALRKGFPKQLSGLYVHEEMDQASSPAPAQVRRVPEGTAAAGGAAAPADLNDAIPEAWQPFVRTSDRVQGHIVHLETESKTGRRSGNPYTKTTITLENGDTYSTLDLELGATALACKAAGTRVEITTKEHPKWGTEIAGIARIPEDGDDDVAL